MNRHNFIAPAVVLAALGLHYAELRARHAEVARLDAEMASLSQQIHNLSRASSVVSGAPPASGEKSAPAAPAKPAPSAPAPAPAPTDKAPPADPPAPRAAPHPVAMNESPGMPGGEPSEGAPEGPTPAQIADVRDHFESQFTTEESDVRWSAEAESTARERLRAALPESSEMGSVECHTSMCRIETTHATMDRYHQFMTNAFLDPATKVWNGGFFSTMVGEPKNGKLTTVTYLAREGQDLPYLDNLL